MPKTMQAKETPAEKPVLSEEIVIPPPIKQLIEHDRQRTSKPRRLSGRKEETVCKKR